MPTPIDKLVKEIDPKRSEIIIRDRVDFSKAVYVSAQDRAENVSLDKIQVQYSNSDAFKEMAKKIKGAMGSKPALIVACDATHYNFVNGNVSWYDNKYIVQNAKSWIQTTVGGVKWGMPIQTDHDAEALKTIGRVHVATPFIYPGAGTVHDEDLTKPGGHIELIYAVTDGMGIEKIMDGRYNTMSVAAGARPDTITCSVCGRPITSIECEHSRGRVYDVEGKTKGSTGKRLAFWIWGPMNYKEASYVNKPADQHAAVKRFEGINVDGMDTVDNISYNVPEMNVIDSQVKKHFSMMVGTLKDNKVIGMETIEGKALMQAQVVSKDSVADGNIEIVMTDSANQPPAVTPPVQAPVGADATAGSVPAQTVPAADCCTSKKGDAEGSAGSDNKDEYRLAVAGLVAEMLSLKAISLEDAIEMLHNEAGIFVPSKNRNAEDVGDILKSILEEKDAKLSTARREKLPKTTFCGPDRSFPVPDCAHVTAARRLIGRYKGSESTKSRILACVSRKASLMGCKSGKDSEDKTITKQEAIEMAKYQFETEQELLGSTPVMKALDDLKTAHEQELDAVKKAAGETEKRFKAIAIDAILTASTKLDKPLVKDLKDAKAEEAPKVRQALVDKLSARTLDSLTDTLNDVNAEVAAKEAGSAADKSQAAVEAALKTPPATTPAATTDAKAPEATNQPGAAADTDKTQPDLLASVTRKKA